MGIIAWIIFGALAGWVASKLAGTDDQMGCLSNIFVGVAGAFIGGVLYKVLTDEKWNFRFNPSSFIVAVIGSVVLLALLRVVRGRA
ncbi:MAG TPA: GlsB/YeaQ/YmgE family stress response membrane protein [Thermomicrobiales bacterium]|nr:GlsB/YeaQ/YmgE family stress response membrane protein [Thermomicrobiales bacterium]